MKKIFLCTFLILFTYCEKSDLKPNFLFIVVDDLGYYDLGVMGSVFMKLLILTELQMKEHYLLKVMPMHQYAAHQGQVY